METRSSYKIVGAVTLILVAALLAFTVWLAGYRGDDNKRYDIFFRQAVSGLAKGSIVSFSGVPVGAVQDISLMPRSPEFVRVRITVQNNTPVTQGTQASIAGVGFTGVSEVRLAGAVTGARPITCPPGGRTARCPFGEPVIPTATGGGLAAAIEGAPELIERVTALTERLTELLSNRNQESLAGILENVDQLSNNFAARSPEIAATLAEARIAIQQTGQAAERIGNLAGTTDRAVQNVAQRDVQLIVRDLRQTIATAENSVRSLDAVITDARPGVQAFSKQTIPEVGALIGDLRDTASSLERVSGRLDQGGITAVLGAPRLPDYEPGRAAPRRTARAPAPEPGKAASR